MSDVWIKNFGDNNYFWEEVKQKNWVSLISDETSCEFVFANDQDGYRNYVKNNLVTNSLKTPNDGIITRWWNDHFNLTSSTPSDIWLYSSGPDLYWTNLLDEPPQYETRADPFPRGRENVNVTLTIRKSKPWSNLDTSGRRLSFRALHPKAREILRNQMTMAKPSKDNASYAIALINGEDLSEWHDRPEWKIKLAEQKHSMTVSADNWTRSFHNLAESTNSITKQSGKTETRRTKTKNFGFKTKNDLINFLKTTHKKQDGRCALTGIHYLPRASILALERRPDNIDEYDKTHWLQMSLDRKDSQKGYEPENLQLTCWFANYWKGSQPNDVFLELLYNIVN